MNVASGFSGYEEKFLRADTEEPNIKPPSGDLNNVLIKLDDDSLVLKMNSKKLTKLLWQ